MNRRQRGGERQGQQSSAQNNKRANRHSRRAKPRNPDKDPERQRNKPKFRRKRTYRQVPVKEPKQFDPSAKNHDPSQQNGAERLETNFRGGSQFSSGCGVSSKQNFPNERQKARLSRNEEMGRDLFLTPEKEGASRHPEKPSFLLLKNLDPLTSESEIRRALSSLHRLKDFPIYRNCGNVYVKFPLLSDILKIIERNKLKPIFPGQASLKVCLVNKLPLDLNQKSKIGNILEDYLRLKWKFSNRFF